MESSRNFPWRTIERDINDSEKSVRLEAATRVGEAVKKGEVKRIVLREVNNHVHTTYSFSPYEPAAAALAAWEAGLGIVGSIDHDSIGAAEEMLEASSRIGIASTVGFEVRSGFQDTPFADKKINNPDSPGIVYMCVHGVPESAIPKAKAFLDPVRKVRNERNKAQVAALNGLIVDTPLQPIDFDRDIVPISRWELGGSITERHILYAFAQKIIDRVGMGKPVVDFLEKTLKLKVEGKVRTFLLDASNVHYVYDLLGILKGNYLPRFFIQPSREETVEVGEVVRFARSVGAIPAYAYLGDVAESVTGDKQAEQFEDDYLDELVAYLAKIGFPAITYMPPRNTKAQMERLQTLCKKHNLMEISGVDINSSRQSFNCPEMLDSGCVHLVDSAWALVAHEKLTEHRIEWDLFHPDNPLSDLPLDERIALYAELGRGMDPFDPSSILDLANTKLH